MLILLVLGGYKYLLFGRNCAHRRHREYEQLAIEVCEQDIFLQVCYDFLFIYLIYFVSSWQSMIVRACAACLCALDWNYTM